MGGLPRHWPRDPPKDCSCRVTLSKGKTVPGGAGVDHPTATLGTGPGAPGGGRDVGPWTRSGRPIVSGCSVSEGVG